MGKKKKWRGKVNGKIGKARRRRAKKIGFGRSKTKKILGFSILGGGIGGDRGHWPKRGGIGVKRGDKGRKRTEK